MITDELSVSVVVWMLDINMPEHNSRKNAGVVKVMDIRLLVPMNVTSHVRVMKQKCVEEEVAILFTQPLISVIWHFVMMATLPPWMSAFLRPLVDLVRDAIPSLVSVLQDSMQYRRNNHPGYSNAVEL